MAHSAELQMTSVLRWVQNMAPEVAEGRPATPASDTYSLGCILYEMLAGTPPFPGDNAIVVALRHAKETPRPISEVNPSVPPALAAIVDRSLEKDPARRYQTAAKCWRTFDARRTLCATINPWTGRPPKPCVP